VLGLTGAQYFAAGLVLASVWIWFRVRPSLAALAPAGPAAAETAAGDVGPAVDDGSPTPDAGRG
jgi:hypothetical protein